MKKLILSLGVAVIGALSAQAGVTAVDGDLVLGFKLSGYNDLMVNLGNADTFITNAKSGGVSVNIGSYLTTVFGADWNTKNVSWAAAASYGTLDANRTTFITSKWGTAAGVEGVQNSTAWGSYANTQLNSATTNMSKFYNGLRNASAANTLSTSAVQVAAANTSSWTASTTTGAAAFTQFNPQGNFNNQVNRLAAGETFSASDLYLLEYGVAGTFQDIALTIGQDGSFSAYTAVPEPSTYAMILGVMTLGFVAVRRRLVKQV